MPLAFFAALMCTVPLVRGQLTLTWGNGSGSWNVGANWSPTFAPGLLDTAQVQGGNGSVDSNVSVNRLLLSGGNVGGSAILSLNGSNSGWTGGSMNSSGTLSLASGASLTISGSGDRDFNAHTIINNGTVDWTGGNLRSGNSGSFTNASGATFNDSATAVINAAWGGSVLFANNGTYNKTAGSTSIDSVTFSNAGSVNVSNGALLVLNGGGTSTGNFTVSSGGTLRFSSTYTVASGGTLGGTGAYELTGGTLTVDANTAAANLAQSSGTLAGSGAFSVGNLTLSGGNSLHGNLTLTSSGSTWTGGNMNGSGAVTIASAATFTISGTVDHDFNAHAITNGGIVNWTGGNLRSGNGGSFTNNAGGTFNDSTSGVINAAWGGSATFTNHGNYNKTAGTTTVGGGVAFDNNAVVNVGNGGTLALTGGGTASSSSSFVVASGGTLNLGGGTYSFSDGTSVSGAGTISLTGGTLSIATGNATFSNLIVNGGTLGGAGNAALNALTSSSGAISINSLTLGGAATWTAGSWNGGGGSTATIKPGSTLTISSGNDHDYNARTITNNGTVEWTGGNLRSGNSGALVNNASWNDSASAVVNNAWGGTTNAFTNSASATYNKTAAGTTRFDVPFTNNGAVSITGGTLELQGGGTASGTFTTGASGTMLFSNSYTITDGAALTGAGTTQVTGGTFSVAGNITLANFQFSGGVLAGTHTLSGTLTWNGGNFNSGGTTSITSTGTLNLAGNFDHDFSSRLITNNGTINWQAGAGRLRSGNGAVIANNGTFNDAASSVMNNDWGGTALVFQNTTSGIYNKTAAGTTRFDVPFNNDGHVNVSAGTLQLQGGGTNSASGMLNAASGASVVFSNSYTLADASSLTGAGAFAVTGGTFTINGTANVSSFAVSGGLLAGTHTLNGAVIWDGGTLNSGGTTTIASGATFNVGGNFDHDFSSRAIVNNGTVNWQAGAGRLRAGNSALLTNNGTLNDAASSVMNNDYGGTALVFKNATTGTYNKTAAGTTRFDVPFNNDGTVNISNGTLQLNGGGTNSASGVLNAASGASVVFSNNYTLDNASALTGAGSFALTAGTLTVNGTATVSSFAVSGGLLAGTHTLNGAVTWNGGNLSSAGTTTIGPGSTFTLSGNFDHDFNVRSIVNNGTMEWTAGAGRLRSGNAGGITNNGTFKDATSSHVNNDYGGTVATFVNASGGTYDKTAGASVYFIPFNNSGAVNVSAGATLTLQGGGTNSASGTINAASGASVVFSNDYTLANASSLAGAGAYSVTGGTLTATGNVNVSNFTFNGGALAGTQTFNGGLIWAGGHFSNGGTTTIAPGSAFTISGNFDHDFNTRAIVNNGTTTWATGAGRLRSGNAATFTNNNLFLDQSASSINNDYGGTALVFTNSAGATYRRTGAGQTNILAPFVNSGLLDIQNGILALHSTNTFNDGSSMTGAGLLQLLNGSLTANGAMTFSNFEIVGGGVDGTHTLGGHVTWTAGQFNNGGSTTVTGTFDVGSGNDHDFNAHAFANTGTLNWTAGRLRSGNGGTFTNSGTFNDTASNAVNNDYGGAAAQFTNAAGGIYNKNGGGTTSFIGVSFVNAGTLNTNLGALNLGGGGSAPAGARFNTALGAALQFTGGSYAIADGLSLAGNGTFAIAGATVTLGTTINVPDFQLNAGTLAGSQTFTGGLTWSAGNMNAGGTTTIGAGGTFAISTANDHDFNTHALVNNGTVTWNAGRLRAGNGSTIVNNNVFNDAASSSLNNDYGGTVLTFTNSAGAFYRKNGGTTSTMLVPFNNAGQIDVSVGTLVLASGGTIGDGASYLGAGATLLTGGTFTASGTIQSTNLILAGAQLAGSQTFTGVLGWDSGHFNNNGTTTIAATSTLKITSANDHDFNTHAFVNNGIVDWTGGRLRSGNSGTITNNGTFKDSASSQINNDYGGAALAFTNNGTYLKAAAGTTFVDVPFTSSGTLVVNAGTLNFRSSFTNNNGGLQVGNGATAQFPGAFTSGTGHIVGTGTISASSVSAGGLVGPGTPIGALNITGSLSLLSTAGLLIDLGGTTQGTGYDFVSVGSTATLGGALALHFVNGFQSSIQSSDTFTVLTGTGGLSGAFANVASGQRIFTTDGFGSFQVNYGVASSFAVNSVVLSNFVPVPEPSTWALLGCGVLVVGVALRRRR